MNHTDCPDAYPGNRNAFWNSLSKVNCRIYFRGHDHSYNHDRINDGDENAGNDVHQMMVATGDEPFFTAYVYVGVNAPYTSQLVYHEQQQYGCFAVEIDGNQIASAYFHRWAVTVMPPLPKYSPTPFRCQRSRAAIL